MREVRSIIQTVCMEVRVFPSKFVAPEKAPAFLAFQQLPKHLTHSAVHSADCFRRRHLASVTNREVQTRQNPPSGFLNQFLKGNVLPEKLLINSRRTTAAKA